jgi:defect-in-organelle-trafficking protein DotB
MQLVKPSGVRRERFARGPKMNEPWTETQFCDLLEYGVSRKMSDIKLIGMSAPFIRVHGRWEPACETFMSHADIERIAVWTSANEGLPSQVKGGHFSDYAYDLRVARNLRRRFRCNATAHVASGGNTGISLVMRKIPDAIPALADVGLEEDGKPGFIVRNCFPPQGIVLWTGPTGSGKTTSLAACIRFLLAARPHLSLETYEDPVEFDYSLARGEGPLVQVSMREHLGGDFSRIAPNAARRSSDVVVIGESRDRDSFRGLVQLADMGLLTFSTLHTRSVAETPSRILNTFPEGERPEIRASLVHGLRLVVQQRLLPRVGGGRIAVHEWLLLEESFRYRLSTMGLPEMIPAIRAEIERRAAADGGGQLLIHDVRRKLAQGLIGEATARVMETENSDLSKMGS